jgi:phosphoribosylformylglycinamidine synthase
VKGTQKGLALTVDGNSRYCYLDPHAGGTIAVAEAARNLACVGAEPLALSDCLNFGSPENPAVMWQFSQAIEGMREACLALEVPVVSGNVSFYNETDGTPIFPTPTIAMVGLLPAVEKHVTPWFKSEGDVIVLLGRTLEEIGGSEYLKVVHGTVGGTPPSIDLNLEKAVHRCCIQAVRRGLLQSAHDVSDGGLAVALAESCVAGPEKPLGAAVRLEGSMRADALLFGESQSRIVVSLKKANLKRLKEIAGRTGAPLEVIGQVGGARLNIRSLLSVPVKHLRSIWSNGLKRRLA